MKQYGDITKLSGYDLEPVDLIVGGSPCQNLSIAGNRKGLEGSESGLFLEMIRIIREMREATHGIYPRFALWENVPGAFSSNEGRDFSVVLGEFARLIESGAPDVPVPEEGWPKAGVLLVSNGQIAWRTHDTQFFGKTIRDSRTGDVLQMGTPQRRRRISLVADFRGESAAAEILFERKGVSGDIEPIGEAGKRTARDPSGSIGKTGTDSTVIIEMTSTKNTIVENGIVPTLTARMETGGNQVNAVYDPSVHHGYKELNDVCETVRSRYGTGGNNVPMVMQGYGTVRRLTPLEVERLQGFPDRWTDVPGASDSKRYKALGNSIALPFWEFLAKRFVQIGNVESIGSLFAGIGGFELVFQRAGAETKWDSEIDPFCRKVLEYHFGNEETNKEGEA